MHTEPKTLLSKILKEHIGSTFKNYRVEPKLLQELGLGLDFIVFWDWTSSCNAYNSKRSVFIKLI